MFFLSSFQKLRNEIKIFSMSKIKKYLNIKNLPYTYLIQQIKNIITYVHLLVFFIT